MAGFGVYLKFYCTADLGGMGCPLLTNQVNTWQNLNCKTLFEKIHMKIYLIILGVLICQIASAQKLENRNLYFKLGGSIGNFNGGKISLEYINLKGQSFSIAMCGQGRRAPNIPKDYVSPSGIFGKILFWGQELDYPKENRTTLYLATGKNIDLNQNGKIRLNFAGGLGCSYLTTPINFIKKEPQGTAENYYYLYKKEYSLGVVLNPSVDFAVWKYFGFSAGILSIISKERFSCGVEVSYLIGLVNNRKK